MDVVTLKTELEARLASLVARAEGIEAELQHGLDADWEEQAIDLADDESLEGVDAVLRGEIAGLRAALARIESGDYGTCARCGGEIAPARLAALPTATFCIACA